ncbi:TonB-dependent receptor [Sphingosinicella humi]|uniref:TonB-dependent receptor n=1 Tax=Allosphingosinicella humi TaxID=2068657 RepID=A0A2U2J0Z4_9SPHN|nr:TonB-dependent receptor [Sphingosinicella humi]PWG01998.1 TonB-dependent receptor [Sphingosinicella humi]
MPRRLISALCLSAAAPLYAQPADIVVTGRGLDESLGDAVYSTVVIDRARLTDSASGRMDEILKDVPGLQLFRRSDARSANPTSQGVTLRALGGNASSRALLILDGVPQTDPFGGWISWPAYDPERLGEVRVTRGGGSGVHGSGALAGTIELLSADPEDLDGTRASLAYGSRDSIDASAGIGVELGSGFLTLSGDYGRGDGFIPIVETQRGPVDRPSPYEQASASLRAVAPLSAGVELQANGLLFRDERERGVPFTGNSTTGADASLRLVGERWSALGYVQTRDYYNSFASVEDDRSAAARVAEQYCVPSTGVGARAEYRPPLGDHIELRLGGDWRETEGRTEERFLFVDGVGTRGRVAGGRTRTLGGFAEIGWENGSLTLTGGARIDRWWIEDGALLERVFATGEILNDVAFTDRAGWEPTGRAGVAWRAAEAVTVRAAGYLGWRLPTLNELFRPFRVGADATAANAELAPERLRGAELGIDVRPVPNARIGATLFVNRLEDAIANVTLGRGPGMFPGVGFVGPSGTFSQRRNLGAIDARGVEIDGAVNFGAWSLSAGYAFVDAEVSAGGLARPLDGLRPAQTPRHSLASTLAWQDGGGARASLTARYVGAQFEDDLNTQSLPDALTFDAAASLPVTPALTVEARAENLTDARVLAGISGDGLIERATPRTLWIGLRYSR